MRPMFRLLCVLLITLTMGASVSRADDTRCEPDWVSSFEGPSGTFGLNTAPPGAAGDIYALTTFDDGSGRGVELYAGGYFTIAGASTANGVARWDGKAWRPLGTGVELGGLNTTKVFALAVFDDGRGGGPALYAGGLFVKAGGLPAEYIARWNGQEWSAVGGGMNAAVQSLAVFDDGSGGGPALYAGGAFTLAGGVPASFIAKWDGQSWTSLSSGVNSSVIALKSFDDGAGAGPKLIAAGAFTTAGGSPAGRVASWDGTTWAALGAGVGSSAFALEVFHDGIQSRLYVGGQFVVAGGQPANRIASWDGRSWSAVGTGITGSSVRSLHVSEIEGRPPVLVVGGQFTAAGGAPANSVAEWDGSTWSALAQGVDVPGNAVGVAYALATTHAEPTAEPTLYVGGRFDSAGGKVATNFARWDGKQWPTMPTGLDSFVFALAAPPESSAVTEEIYAGGAFDIASGKVVNGIARWDGESWHALGSGVVGEVYALAFFDDGRGEGLAIYAGGAFGTAGGVPANGIAKWNGSSWSPVGAGVSGVVLALTVFDDGQGEGPALYAGGAFGTAGGVPANGIAKWNGSSWSPLEQGLAGPAGRCYALHVHDDGTGAGAALYVGGSFETAGAISASNIAKWDGTSWSALGSGTNDEVWALASLDDGDGRGPKLIAAGWFSAAGGLPANSTASWNGTEWAAMGTGTSGTSEGVLALAVMPDRFGGSSRLYAARGYVLDRWDGAEWTELAPDTYPGAASLLSHSGTPSRPPSLVLGGNRPASATGDSWIARLAGCPSDCPSDLTFDGIVGQEDLAVLLGAWGASGGDLDANGTTSSTDLAVMLGAWGNCP